MWDAIWINCNLATIADEAGYGVIIDGALAIQEGRIAFVGKRDALDGRPDEVASEVHDAGGAWILPGLVDPHTHVVYAGNGRLDFLMRINNATSAEIAAAGGGVRGTVRVTRETSAEELFATAARRVGELISHGVTTVESKSGFGLDLQSELKLLRCSRELGAALPVTVVSTFLGAHMVAPEYTGRADEYIEFLADQVLPIAVADGLVDAVDGWADTMGFSDAQIGRLFDAAQSFGLPVRLHADQWSDASAGALAARYRALTADHLEFASEASVEAMAAAGTVAGLLPGTNYRLRETQKPPIQLFRKHGVRMSLATNSNPVSSPTNSPPMIMNLGCMLFKMTPEEAVRGFTINAAHGLNMQDERGSLTVGKAGDLSLWDIEHPDDLSHLIAANRCVAVVKDGRVVHEAARPRPWKRPV
ncbi:imidazolonepropionase [Bradyrhizobium sp. 179]|uniref:imidazolonepropionase n=1 Tax=Bradyrhizobium sp. 179 TaxID=2782648 RepID=UPI001FF86347|nr:imidazolonepropionase [Bradyrhizobium sp. 179]